MGENFKKNVHTLNHFAVRLKLAERRKSSIFQEKSKKQNILKLF